MIRLRVLIAIANCSQLQPLIAQLRRLRIDVLTASDIDSANTLLCYSSPQLVILDEAWQHIVPRIAHRASALPVILLCRELEHFDATPNGDNPPHARSQDLPAYRVALCDDLWPRLEPLVFELLDLPPRTSDHSIAVARA